MHTFTLPLSSKDLAMIRDTDTIDMSAAQFENDIVTSSFLFIRNASIHCKFDFSHCSFDLKSEFLLTFLTGKYNLKLPILSMTWMEILFQNSAEMVYPSILSLEEITTFVEIHKDLITLIQSVIQSIPLISMKYGADHLNETCPITISFDDIETSNDDSLNIHNFISLMEYDDFIHLIHRNLDQKPIYYTKYFNNHMYIDRMIKKLPYLNIFNLLINQRPEQKESFIKAVEDVLDASMNPKEEV